MTAMATRIVGFALGAFLALDAVPAWASHRANNEVLVGGAISMTGQYAEPAGRQVNAIKLWVDDVNAHGGLLGHKIVLRLLDDKSDVQTSIKPSYFADSVAQLRQMREQNLNFKLYSSTVGPGLPNFAEQLGPTAEYVLGYSQWEPLPDVLKLRGIKEFIAAYEKRYGEKPNYHAGGTYGALQVTAAAVTKADSFDGDKVREAMATLDMDTVFGHYKVDAKGMNTPEGLTFQILKGQRRVVWPENLAQTKPELPMPDWSKR
jgi:ABC-type branched-subunit amino acid transport system substrate-binding protein